MINLRIFSLSEQGYVCPVGLPREFLKMRHDQYHFNYLWIFLKAHSLASTPIKTLLLWNFSLSFSCFLALKMISKQYTPKVYIYIYIYIHICVCVCVIYSVVSNSTWHYCTIEWSFQNASLINQCNTSY